MLSCAYLGYPVYAMVQFALSCGASYCTEVYCVHLRPVFVYILHSFALHHAALKCTMCVPCLCVLAPHRPLKCTTCVCVCVLWLHTGLSLMANQVQAQLDAAGSLRNEGAQSSWNSLALTGQEHQGGSV